MRSRRSSPARPMGRRKRLVALTVGVSSVGLGIGGLGLGSIVSSPTAGAATITNVQVTSRPTLPGGATSLGAMASTAAISGDIALAPRDASGLASYAAAVANPRSPEYRRYLSLGAFDAMFSPSASTVRAVERVLASGGLRVTSVAQDDLLVGFTGPATLVGATFHTTIENYRLASGRAVFANDSAVTLPDTVASTIQAVIGLNDLVAPQPAPTERATTAHAASENVPQDVVPPTGAARACSAAADIAATYSALTANDVAYAYGLDPLYAAKDFGQNQTVDILDLFGYSTSDIAAFDDCYYGATEGATVAANDGVDDVDNGTQPGDGTGGSVETELDVETVNAYAPRSKVVVYEAPDSNSGFLDDVAAMSSSSATVESISYGMCEELMLADEPGYAQEENYLFEQAAAMGKTVFASTGDNGSDSCSLDSGQPVAPILSDSDPASQPYVTAVGGTAITAATDPPAEEVWNDGAAGGSGGGGISDIWPEPAWQASTAVPGITNSTVVAEAEAVGGDDFCQGSAAGAACREVPDVSAQASPNTGGFPVFIDGGWAVYGGTSLASPTWGAILADIGSTATCTSAGGPGFISPQLYAIASVPAEYAASFNDVTVGNNDNFGAADGLYPATPGYDMASGLGTPKVTGADGSDGLAYYLCAAPAVTPPTITSVNPTALSSSAVSSGTTLSINGTGFESGGISDVADVSIGSSTVPATDYSVVSASEITVDVPTDLFSEQLGNGGTGDGSGTYAVTVTLTGGATSVPNGHARLSLYDSGGGAAGTTPVVDGTFPSAGIDAGGVSVTVYGSGFTASGTADVASVTFGGVAAPTFTVDNDDTITAVTPAEPSSSACVAGDDPTTGVCQVQVQVVLDDGVASAEGTIPLEFSGALAAATSSAGLYAAATEFDDEPAPTITSIQTVAPPDLASEAGGTEVVMTGTGLGALGLEWVNVGSYLNASSEDVSLVDMSSTSLTFFLPPEAPTSAPASVPLTVQTYGSPNTAPGAMLGSVAPSNTANVTYAPVPKVASMAVAGSTYLAGPTNGGSTLTLSGSGFDDAELIYFSDVKYGFPTTQYDFTVVSDSEITLTTPAALTGVYAVVVCGVSGCSSPSASHYTYYLPGNPQLTSAAPKAGRAGTKVTIRGDNLGFTEAVYFGTRKATAFSQAGLFESGNTYELTATAPPSAAGATVDIRVVTVQSLATGYGKSSANPDVTFTYTTKAP